VQGAVLEHNGALRLGVHRGVVEQALGQIFLLDVHGILVAVRLLVKGGRGVGDEGRLLRVCADGGVWSARARRGGACGRGAQLGLEDGGGLLFSSQRGSRVAHLEAAARGVE
jgi:hypothetical protein